MSDSMKDRLIKKFEDEILALDRELKLAPRISFHPNINTATFVLGYADFERFLASCENLVRYIDVSRG